MDVHVWGHQHQHRRLQGETQPSNDSNPDFDFDFDCDFGLWSFRSGKDYQPFVIIFNILLLLLLASSFAWWRGGRYCRRHRRARHRPSHLLQRSADTTSININMPNYLAKMLTYLTPNYLPSFLANIPTYLSIYPWWPLTILHGPTPLSSSPDSHVRYVHHVTSPTAYNISVHARSTHPFLLIYPPRFGDACEYFLSPYQHTLSIHSLNTPY